MARKENTIKTEFGGPEKEPRAEKTEAPVAVPRKKKKNQSAFMQKVDAFLDWIQTPQGRKTSALSLIVLSIILFVAFISHFFTGFRDQSLVESGGMFGEPSIEKPSNWLGSFGAFFANIFITKGFGAMALLIPAYTGLWGFALLENDYYRSVWKLTKYVIFSVLWGSTFFAFISYVFTGHVGDLGGGFGWYLCDTMFNFIGKVGMGLIILVSMLIFLVVNFNTEIPITRWLADLFIAKKPELALENGGVIAPEKETTENESSEVTAEKEAEEETEEDDVPLEMELMVNGGAEDSSAGNETLMLDPEAGLSPELTETPLEIVSPENLELEISNTGDVPIENLHPEVERPSGDNIVETEEGKFEKFVAEEDEETLDDEEVLAAEWEQYDPTKDLAGYEFPPLDLLNQYESSASREVNRAELEENKNKIVRTLNNYKIEIVSIKATIGPTVTLYEIVPAPGVRISKIKNLEDDIALSLAALGIRIIAPIPGKGTIGIEIPNSNAEMVPMRGVLGTERFRDTKAELPLAMGKTISNEVYVGDLSKMPHLLIAGATGQGKSVGINGLIASLLFKKHPSQIKFVLIDPKKVELSLYSALEKHFLAKLESFDESIITDTKQVIYVLNSLCIEMDTRYDLLKKARVRNLREYNQKFMARRLNPKKGHRYMPYIVLIIDEFADLMMTAGKEIETPIARLAQLARAIGIHLVLATQRPSVNVITGIIKANFPARVSFRVTSKVDSRTILDTGGADQLVGRGDMLILTENDLIRVQNSFIDTPEVERLVEFIADQRGYTTPYYLPEVPMDSGSDDDDDGDNEPGERDEMFAEAARLVVKHQQGSTSLIQRRMKLGYNRAGRIMDQLEHAGIVGPFSGSKARDVLVHDEYALEQILRDMI